MEPPARRADDFAHDAWHRDSGSLFRRAWTNSADHLLEKPKIARLARNSVAAFVVLGVLGLRRVRRNFRVGKPNPSVSRGVQHRDSIQNIPRYARGRRRSRRTVLFR